MTCAQHHILTWVIGTEKSIIENCSNQRSTHCTTKAIVIPWKIFPPNLSPRYRTHMNPLLCPPLSSAITARLRLRLPKQKYLLRPRKSWHGPDTRMIKSPTRSSANLFATFTTVSLLFIVGSSESFSSLICPFLYGYAPGAWMRSVSGGLSLSTSFPQF